MSLRFNSGHLKILLQHYWHRYCITFGEGTLLVIIILPPFSFETFPINFYSLIVDWCVYEWIWNSFSFTSFVFNLFVLFCVFFFFFFFVFFLSPFNLYCFMLLIKQYFHFSLNKIILCCKPKTTNKNFQTEPKSSIKCFRPLSLWLLVDRRTSKGSQQNAVKDNISNNKSRGKRNKKVEKKDIQWKWASLSQ